MIRNPFNPIRFLGGPSSGEDLNRVEDRIRIAIGELIAMMTATFSPIGPNTPSGVPGAPSNARFWLSQLSPSLPFAVDMGALGAGILQQTVGGGIATPDSFLPTAGSVLFAGTAGTLAQDNPNFFYDAAAVRWGFGTNAPAAETMLTAQRNANSPLRWMLTNSDGGANNAVQLLLQAGASNTFAFPPYIVIGSFGPGFVNSSPDAPFEPFYVASNSLIQSHGNGDLVIHGARGSIAGGDVVIITSRPSIIQTEAVRIDNLTGVVKVRTLNAGGVVYADTPDGTLKLVTIGSGLSFSAGTLSATGGTGTVTSVSGTAPIVITGSPTTTPNVTITDFVASGASHARGAVPDPGAGAGTSRFLREDATWAVPPDTDTGITQLTGDGTAGPGSGSQAFTLANVVAGATVAPPASITFNSKGLITAASALSFTTGSVMFWSGGTFAQDNAGLFYDDGNRILSIGTNTVTAGQKLKVIGSRTLASATSLTFDPVYVDVGTLTLTGATHVTTARGIDGVYIKGGTITSASALTVDLAATVYIDGAMNSGGSTTIGTSVALFVTNGNSFFDTGSDVSVYTLTARAGANIQDLQVPAGSGTFRADGTNTKIAFFGVVETGQVTGGAATAGVVYTATEQAMLQTAYDALRTYGLLS